MMNEGIHSRGGRIVRESWMDMYTLFYLKWKTRLPGGAVDKNTSANAGDMGSIPGSGRFHTPWSI